MSEDNQLIFHYWPWQDEKKIIKKVRDTQSGLHLFYRKVKEQFRARLCQLIDHQSIPQVFLFGSPHIENYARTDTGCGLIDFDRALYGPYISDIMMIMLSMAIKRENQDGQFIPETIYQSFYQGYLTGLSLTEATWPHYSPLMQQPTKPWQISTRAYVEAGKKWIKRARKKPLMPDDPILWQLLRQYFTHRNQSAMLNHIDVVEAGCASGSMGRLHTFAVLTAPEWSDWVILDFKPALNYVNSTWPHSQFYHHPFQHEGKRMMEASRLLAPEVTDGESYATVNGIQYWARRLPPLSLKVKKDFSDPNLVDFAAATATQIGRGHAMTLTKPWSRSQLESHFTQHFQAWYPHFETVYQDFVQGWHHYIAIADLNNKT